MLTNEALWTKLFSFSYSLSLSLLLFLSVSSIRAVTEAKCGLWIHVELIHLRWSLFPQWLSGDVSKYFPLSDETWDFSWDIRFYHETQDRRFSSGGVPPQENLLSREKVSCLMLSPWIPQEWWDMIFSRGAWDV